MKSKLEKLQKPSHKYGYTQSDIKKILKKLGIDRADFDNAFGINTCAMDKKGNLILYPCDVQRALFKLGCKYGENIGWD